MKENLKVWKRVLQNVCNARFELYLNFKVWKRALQNVCDARFELYLKPYCSKAGVANISQRPLSNFKVWSWISSYMMIPIVSKPQSIDHLLIDVWILWCLLFHHQSIDINRYWTISKWMILIISIDIPMEDLDKISFDIYWYHVWYHEISCEYLMISLSPTWWKSINWG